MWLEPKSSFFDLSSAIDGAVYLKLHSGIIPIVVRSPIGSSGADSFENPIPSSPW